MSEPGEAPPRVDQPLIPPFLPRMIHRLALPIVLVWLGIVFITNTVAPQLEVVASLNHRHDTMCSFGDGAQCLFCSAQMDERRPQRITHDNSQ